MKTVANETEIIIPYAPHKGRDGESGQWLVHKSDAQWKVLKKSRRWGGSRCAVNEGFMNYRRWYNDEHDPSMIPTLQFMTLVPSYTAAVQAWREMQYFAVPFDKAGLLIQIKKDDPKTIILELPDGRLEWELLSTEDPKALIGRGADYAWIYDAAYHTNNMWDEYLRPIITSPGRHNRAFIEGKPTTSLSYFERLYERGQDPSDNKVESWHFTAFESPFIEDEEIWDALKDMTEAKWRQEFMAETVDALYSAFQNVDSCAVSLPEEPVEGRSYVIGCDLGKALDWTVLIIMDRERRRVVSMERFSKIDWDIQKTRIKGAVKKWGNPTIVMDSSNVGDAIMSDLKADGITVRGVNCHSTVEKKRVIKNLQLALEKETVHFPKTFPTKNEGSSLFNELKMYQEKTVNKMGDPLKTPMWGAPSGQHDDCVIALALALDGCPRFGGWDTPVKKREPAVKFF